MIGSEARRQTGGQTVLLTELEHVTDADRPTDQQTGIDRQTDKRA